MLRVSWRNCLGGNWKAQRTKEKGKQPTKKAEEKNQRNKKQKLDKTKGNGIEGEKNCFRCYMSCWGAVNVGRCVRLYFNQKEWFAHFAHYGG